VKDGHRKRWPFLRVANGVARVQAFGMAESAHIPNSLHGESQGQRQTVRYLYVIKHPDASVYITNHSDPISVTNLPAAWRHGTPQAFTPAQVAHSSIRNEMEFTDRSVAVRVSSQDPYLRKYFLDAPAVKIDVAIIRVSSSGLNVEDPDAIDFERNCQVVQSGSLGRIAIESGVIQAMLTPLAFDPNRSVPRFYFQRQCNHMLYDPDTCYIGARQHMISSTIAAVDRPNRSITVNSVHAADTFYGGGGDVGGSVFNNGYILHLVTGQRFGIVSATFVPATSTTFVLNHWMDVLAVTDTIEAFWGCNRTAEHCERFNNLSNFGGFPYVPNENVGIQGASP